MINFFVVRAFYSLIIVDNNYNTTKLILEFILLNWEAMPDDQ